MHWPAMTDAMPWRGTTSAMTTARRRASFTGALYPTGFECRGSLVMAVDDRVALAARDQPAVHRKGRDGGDGKREGKAAPEERGIEPCVHGARNHQHDR